LDDKKIWEAKAKSWVSQCEHVISAWTGYENFVLSKCTLDWAITRRASRGGWYKEGPGISIAMSQACMPRFAPFRIYEYKSFDSDPVIGGFYATDENLALGLHVCHEMAHAAQFYSHFELGIESDKPHGLLFRKLYSIIRTEVLNKKIPINQAQLKNELDNEISLIVKRKYT
jgi:hypothetical protein